MSRVLTVVDHEGMLAVAEPWSALHTEPVMARMVWVSKIKAADHSHLVGLTVDGLPTANASQTWIHQRGNYSTSFTTPKHGVLVRGTVIKPPRKKVGQRTPWRWEAGGWTLIRKDP